MSTSQSRLADVVLLYLSVKRKQAPTTAVVEKSLSTFAPSAPLRGAVEALAEAGHIEAVGRSGWAVTAEGSERLYSAFGLRAPVSKSWGSLKRLIASKALGVPLRPGAKPSKPIDLQKRALAHLSGVAGASTKGPTRAVEELVWKHLGGAEGVPPTWKKLRELVLNQMLGSNRPLPEDKAAQALLARKLGLPRVTSSGVDEALIHRWLDESTEQARDSSPPLGAPAAESANGQTSSRGGAIAPQALSREDVDALDSNLLESHLPEILDAARENDVAGHGDHKRFLSSVYEAYRGRRGDAALPWPQFVRLLLQAHLQDRVTLTRADLVSVMDPKVVESSEVLYEGARFHFLTLEEGRP